MVPKFRCQMQATISALEPQNCDHIIKTRSVLGAPADETTIRFTRAAPRTRSGILEASKELTRRTGQYPLIQQVIPGAADSAIGVSMVVSPKGEFLLAYCVRRLRLASYKIDAGYVHPYELGSVVWCETTHDDEALDAARELVRLFRYTGQITVEFRRDSRDGSLYLMKIEPQPSRNKSFDGYRHGHSDGAVYGLPGRHSESYDGVSGRSRVVVDNQLRQVFGIQRSLQSARHISGLARRPPNQGLW